MNVLGSSLALNLNFYQYISPLTKSVGALILISAKVFGPCWQAEQGEQSSRATTYLKKSK